MKPKPLVYFTFNDQPSGVYESQVSDVCRYYESSTGRKATLVAMISLRSFFRNRRTLRRSWSRVWVIPMAPGVKRWKWNLPILMLLALFLGRRTWIGRNPFAASLALKLRGLKLARRVVYDGRGAVHPEWTEYELIKDAALLEQLKNIEKECVLRADHRLAVSAALVNWWKEQFGYEPGKEVVIPCTLHSRQTSALVSDPEARAKRIKAGYTDQDIVIVYSGSTAGWQSGHRMESWFRKALTTNPAVKILLLSRFNDSAARLETQFPGRVKCQWMRSSEVPALLPACDYGLLIRDTSVTNEVSSPTKFAEYLAAGLPVIISDGIGDFTAFVKEHQCGIHESIELEALKPLDADTRKRMQETALRYFVKNAYEKQYLELAGGKG